MWRGGGRVLALAMRGKAFPGSLAVGSQSVGVQLYKVSELAAASKGEPWGQVAQFGNVYVCAIIGEAFPGSLAVGFHGGDVRLYNLRDLAAARRDEPWGQVAMGDDTVFCFP